MDDDDDDDDDELTRGGLAAGGGWKGNQLLEIFHHGLDPYFWLELEYFDEIFDNVNEGL